MEQKPSKKSGMSGLDKSAPKSATSNKKAWIVVGIIAAIAIALVLIF